MSAEPERPLVGEGLRILRNAGSILLGDAGGEVLTTYAVALTALSVGPSGFGTLAEVQAFMDPVEIAAFWIISVGVLFAPSY